MSEVFDVARKPLAILASVAGLATAAGCGGGEADALAVARSGDDEQAVALIREMNVGTTVYKDGVRISRYNTQPSHPELDTWGLLQFCDKKGNLIQLTLSGNENPGESADVINTTRAKFRGYKKQCEDETVSGSDLPAPAKTIPGGNSS